MKTFTFCIFSVLILTNCHLHAENTVLKTAMNSTIINGTAVSSEDSIASHTVLVHDIKNDYICTGVIILKNVVLTAAHCLARNHNNFEIIFSTKAYSLMDDHNDAKFIRHAEKVVIHENYISDYTKQPSMNQSDIGLVYFRGELPEGYVPAQIKMDDYIIKTGQLMIMAGYGVTKMTGTDVKYKKSQKFQADIDDGIILCDHDVKDINGDPTCMEVDVDGNGELMKTRAYVKTIFEHEFVLDEKLTGTCQGDSGGPVFVEENGVQYLVGITSRGDLLCNGIGIYTAVPSFIEWILNN
ncbi:MAG: trypsin-like serine protease [Moraxellaceae bacterium]|nr:trypsin-like serine protease [Pseudobdellovibrionaceae bacterium]